MNSLLLASSGGSHDPIDHVVQHPIITLNQNGSFEFTILSNQIVMQILAGLLLLWLIPLAARKRAGTDDIGRHVPRGFLANALEWICVTLRENVFRPALGKHTDTFTPYLWTVFFFILMCNLLGMVPLDPWNKVLFGGVPILGGTPTGNVWVTATLALCTLFMIVYHGVRLGGTAFLKHFFSVGPFPFNIILFGPLEIVGLLARIFALTIRLFANMMAGHVLLAVLIGFLLTMSDTMAQAGALGVVGGSVVMVVIVLGSLFVSTLELVLVVPLQALIFTLLTAVFIGQAVNIEHEHEHEHELGHGPDASHGAAPAPAHA
ncbi:MAG: F0F1 ATP synthase subunit A [Phycisphaerae bacterium]